MIATDGIAIPIAARHDDEQVRPAQLQACGQWQGAAVDTVEAVTVGIRGHPGGTANAGDDGDLFRGPAKFRQCLGDGEQDREIAAAWTPDRLQIRFEVVGAQWTGGLGAHDSHSSNLLAISAALNGFGPGRAYRSAFDGSSNCAFRCP